MKLKEHLFYLIRFVKLLIITLILIGLVATAIILGIGMIYPGFCSMAFPTSERIGDLNQGETVLSFRSERTPPYRLVLGIPGNLQSPPPFRGSVELRNTQGTTLVIPFDSRDTLIQTLPISAHATGFMLNDRTRPTSTDFLKTRGELYYIRVTFDVPPPTGSSLWQECLDRRSAITGKPAIQHQTSNASWSEQ